MPHPNVAEARVPGSETHLGGTSAQSELHTSLDKCVLLPAPRTNSKDYTGQTLGAHSHEHPLTTCSPCLKPSNGLCYGGIPLGHFWLQATYVEEMCHARLLTWEGWESDPVEALRKWRNDLWTCYKALFQITSSRKHLFKTVASRSVLKTVRMTRGPQGGSPVPPLIATSSSNSTKKPSNRATHRRFFHLTKNNNNKK